MSGAIKVDFDTYAQTATRDGVPMPDRSGERTAGEVQMFLNARSFFDSLVDQPETHEQEGGGTIVVTQQTPDGETQVTRFEPLS